MLKNFILAASFCGSVLFAHPEKMTSIQGPQINLQTINHSFAGAIKHRMVMGYKKAGSFVSEISLLDRDRKSVSTFKVVDNNSFEGEFVTSGEGGLRKHTVKMLEFVREEDRFVFLFDGVPTDVYVTADAFTHGHFINPQYSMTYNGEQVSFKIEDGQACYGYSMHLIAMIMSAYIF